MAGSESRDRVLVLDAPSARWMERELDPRALAAHFPFGMDLFECDLAALLAGRVQIWELCSCALRQWFLGALPESPTAFLYAYVDEANRPELSEKSYELQLGQLRSVAAAGR